MTTATVMVLNSKDYHGVDMDLDISLHEYGILVANKPDVCNEHHVIYGTATDANGMYTQFDSKFMSESDVDTKLGDLLNGRMGFFDTQGCEIDAWLALPLIHKIHSMIGYWGHQDVMGVSYQEPVAIQLI